MALASSTIHLPGTARGITMTQVFDAPAWLVFDTFTRPELVRRWWGPSSLTTHCTAEVRSNGQFCYETLDEHAVESVTGEYVLIERRQRLKFTFCREREKRRAEAEATASFFQDGQLTHLVLTLRYASPEKLASALATGLESTTAARFDRLAILLSALV